MARRRSAWPLDRRDRHACVYRDDAGLVGELVDMDDALAKVKIAPGVTVQIVANTVTPFVSPADKATAKELKEAKAVSEKK